MIEKSDRMRVARAEEELATVVTVLTPENRGAVATLAVQGPRAMEAVASCFRPARGGDLRRVAPMSLVFGVWESSGEDLVLACRSAEDIEIHCHGGRAAVEIVLGDLRRSGCLCAEWKAYLERQASPLQAAIDRQLCDATTQRTAAVLLDQRSGLLERRIRRILDRARAGDGQAAAEGLSDMLAFASFSKHLVVPWTLAIVGKPNAGKSSLLNCLVGFERAIVHESAGTTRDVLTARSAVRGWPVRFADTAGLRATTDAVEREGVRRARDQLSDADLVILVSDRNQPWDDGDQQLLQDVCGAGCFLVVHNKGDLPSAAGRRPPGLTVSCVDRQGIDELLAAIEARLVPRIPAAHDAIPVGEDVLQSLSVAYASIVAGDFTEPIRLLEELLGGAG